MNFKQKFLTLSIRHQISIIIIILSFLCLFLIIALFSLYTNIIINMQCRKRRQFYFEKYKNVISCEIEFQSFLLYQYEQIIKTFNSQVYHYGNSLNDLYDTMVSYSQNKVKDYRETTDKDYNRFNIENPTYFLLSFSNDPIMDRYLYNLLANTHSSIDNQLKAMSNFRIPFLSIMLRIINDYVFVYLSRQSLFSTNRTRIKEIESISGGNFSGYYDNLTEIYYKKYKNFMNAYKKGELYFMNIFFPDKYYLFSNYVNETFLKEKYNNNVRSYLGDIAHNFHFIDYSTEKIFITDNGNKNKISFIEENTIIDDYLNKIFMKAKSISNFEIIPVYNENNTILSTNLCYSFLYKQMIFLNLTLKENIFTEEKLNEIYNKLKKGESNIDDCILDKKYNLDTGHNAYDIINIKFNKFYSIKNIREFSVFRLSDMPYGQDFFYSKYTFPDIASILGFKPTFLTLEQLNIYSFRPLMESKHYEENMVVFFHYCQYLIILCLLYLWIIIIIYLIYRLKKLFIEVIEPINNLIKVINNLEIDEDNMLKYESDDSINELFKLCNELLLGKYKQKIVHDSELENSMSKYDNSMMDYNNLKINRKLIEEMIENKNEYNIKGDEIIDFKVNEYLNKRKVIININNNINNNISSNINPINNLRKTTVIRKKIGNQSNNLGLINSIQSSIKKTRSINQKINLLNKKMSFDVNLTNNNENLISLENKSEEDILELEILLNYKNLYDIVDLIFNYDLKNDKKFISKKSKLLYKSNINNYNKFHKNKLKRKLTSNKLDIEENKIKNENSDQVSINEKEIKDGSKIKLEDFDKSVIAAYETKNIFFLWYEEAKYFKGIEFLQSNHSKELNNLYLIINGNQNKKPNKQSNKNFNKNNINNMNNINNNAHQKKMPLLKKTNKDNSFIELIRKSKTNE